MSTRELPSPRTRTAHTKRLNAANGKALRYDAERERVMSIQRARMIAAMAQASAELGAGSVTIAHVVERAGVSRRTFYEVFADREDCFLATFEEAIARASHALGDAWASEAKWEQRVRSALAELLRFFDEDPAAARLLVVESLAAGPKALQRRQQSLALMIAAVAEGGTPTDNGTEAEPLTAEAVVGGALAVLHARIATGRPASLLELTGPLMSMIVHPYLGAAAARRELAKEVPVASARPVPDGSVLQQLEMRLTYRTVRVLSALAEDPGSSNRRVADAAGVTDQGQMSKLLARLQQLGLIANNAGNVRGERNAWTLTRKGWRVQSALAAQAA